MAAELAAAAVVELLLLLLHLLLLLPSVLSAVGTTAVATNFLRVSNFIVVVVFLVGGERKEHTSWQRSAFLVDTLTPLVAEVVAGTGKAGALVVVVETRN